MWWVDALIVLLAAISIYRGRHTGFIRQSSATIGFVGGLLIGIWLQRYTIQWAHTPESRAIVALVTTVGFAIILLAIGQTIGFRLKHVVLQKRVNDLDGALGALLSLGSLLFTVWLLAAIVSTQSLPSLQTAVRNSKIVNYLNHSLPSAPTIIAEVGRLINPNGFPAVFIGGEPNPNLTKLPSVGELNDAVQADRASVVRVEGEGCGGIVEGSGFVVGAGYVATNAHVIAGIKHPYIQDAKGAHSATVVAFDSKLDFAVLKVSNLAGNPLLISDAIVDDGAIAAVLGYPGGGPLDVKVAAVLDQFTARGRDIYDKNETLRDVYEVQADIIPGNSGGPLIAKDGRVIGVVFAQSTTYNHVGYALTTTQLVSSIKRAEAMQHSVSTGSCAQ